MADSDSEVAEVHSALADNPWLSGIADYVKNQDAGNWTVDIINFDAHVPEATVTKITKVTHRSGSQARYVARVSCTDAASNKPSKYFLVKIARVAVDGQDEEAVGKTVTMFSIPHIIPAVHQYVEATRPAVVLVPFLFDGVPLAKWRKSSNPTKQPPFQLSVKELLTGIATILQALELWKNKLGGQLRPADMHLDNILVQRLSTGETRFWLIDLGHFFVSTVPLNTADTSVAVLKTVGARSNSSKGNTYEAGVMLFVNDLMTRGIFSGCSDYQTYKPVVKKLWTVMRHVYVQYKLGLGQALKKIEDAFTAAGEPRMAGWAIALETRVGSVFFVGAAGILSP
jgi:ribosomal 30S subunit maturation factor RimM